MNKIYSTKESTFLQVKGYPGLAIMAEKMSEFFPKEIKIYVEPFAGLARTAKFCVAEKKVLNDLSDYSIKYMRENFPNAEITQEDYRIVIDRYKDNEDVFMLIDPPWRKNIYKNNALPVCTNTPIEYYDDILARLRDSKCKWILCVDKDEHEIGKRVSKSGYKNVVIEHPTRTLFNRKVGVRMAFSSLDKPTDK